MRHSELEQVAVMTGADWFGPLKVCRRYMPPAPRVWAERQKAVEQFARRRALWLKLWREFHGMTVRERQELRVARLMRCGNRDGGAAGDS